MPSLVAPVLPAGTFASRPQPSLDAPDGLLLRPWRDEDAPAVHAAYRDPAIQRWHRRGSGSPAEAAAWVAQWRASWQDERHAHWAVVDADGPDAVLGRASLRGVLLGEGVAEATYWVMPDARGRGVAPRALGALAGWALGETGFVRLSLRHSVANSPSCRVAEKSGFAAEGTERRAMRHADGWHDMHLHGRTAA